MPFDSYGQLTEVGFQIGRRAADEPAKRQDDLAYEIQKLQARPALGPALLPDAFEKTLATFGSPGAFPLLDREGEVDQLARPVRQSRRF